MNTFLKNNVVDNNKIFIQIASYRDPQLLPTLRNCIINAQYPDNLIFSIAWQHSSSDEWDNLDEYKNDNRFKIIDIDYKDSKGACWARNLLQQNYNGEQYTLQLDSHHRFEKNWDTMCIEMFRDLIKKGHTKPLLTAYLPEYYPCDESKNKCILKIKYTQFHNDGFPLCFPVYMDDDDDISNPIPARFYSAHFAFTWGQFVTEVPHDPNLYFSGEEGSITVRAYTWGYDLFHPHKVVAYHAYKKTDDVARHWNDNYDGADKNNKAFKRNKKLFGMDGEVMNNESFGIYGFGVIRTLEDYERYAGISFKRRSAQEYTKLGKYPPNPPLYGKEFNESFLQFNKRML